MDTRDTTLKEIEKLLADSAHLLQEARESIERCEAMPRLDSRTTIDHHRPDKRLRPIH